VMQPAANIATPPSMSLLPSPLSSVLSENRTTDHQDRTLGMPPHRAPATSGLNRKPRSYQPFTPLRRFTEAPHAAAAITPLIERTPSPTAVHLNPTPSMSLWNEPIALNARATIDKLTSPTRRTGRRTSQSDRSARRSCADGAEADQPPGRPNVPEHPRQSRTHLGPGPEPRPQTPIRNHRAP